MDYELIEDITHADVAVRVKASTLDELFLKSGRALISEMVENSGEISPIISKEGSFANTSLEMLYFEFMNEILFFKDAESLLLLPAGVQIIEADGEFRCIYKLTGEKIIRDKHKFRVDVKAVTLHGLNIFYSNGVYTSETVFDV